VLHLVWSAMIAGGIAGLTVAVAQLMLDRSAGTNYADFVLMVLLFAVLAGSVLGVAVVLVFGLPGLWLSRRYPLGTTSTVVWGACGALIGWAAGHGIGFMAGDPMNATGLICCTLGGAVAAVVFWRRTGRSTVRSAQNAP